VESKYKIELYDDYIRKELHWALEPKKALDVVYSISEAGLTKKERRDIIAEKKRLQSYALKPLTILPVKLHNDALPEISDFQFRGDTTALVDKMIARRFADIHIDGANLLSSGEEKNLKTLICESYDQQSTLGKLSKKWFLFKRSLFSYLFVTKKADFVLFPLAGAAAMAIVGLSTNIFDKSDPHTSNQLFSQSAAHLSKITDSAISISNDLYAVPGTVFTFENDKTLKQNMRSLISTYQAPPTLPVNNKLLLQSVGTEPAWRETELDNNLHIKNGIEYVENAIDVHSKLQRACQTDANCGIEENELDELAGNIETSIKDLYGHVVGKEELITDFGCKLGYLTLLTTVLDSTKDFLRSGQLFIDYFAKNKSETHLDSAICSEYYSHYLVAVADKIPLFLTADTDLQNEFKDAIAYLNLKRNGDYFHYQVSTALDAITLYKNNDKHLEAINVFNAMHENLIQLGKNRTTDDSMLKYKRQLTSGYPFVPEANDLKTALAETRVRNFDLQYALESRDSLPDDIYRSQSNILDNLSSKF